MDFVHDALADGRPFRVLTSSFNVDQWSRHSPILEVNSSISGRTVGAALDRVLTEGAVPRSITVDHDTEFMSRALENWAFARGVQLDSIRPGTPVENAFIEAFNGRLRDECLNVHQFTSIEDARAKIEAWRVDYNMHRPHSSLGHLTPNVCRPTSGRTDRDAAGFSSYRLCLNGTNVQRQPCMVLSRVLSCTRDASVTGWPITGEVGDTDEMSGAVLSDTSARSLRLMERTSPDKPRANA